MLMKKDFKYGDRVVIGGLGTNLFDGMVATVIGVANRDIVDIYIVEFDKVQGGEGQDSFKAISIAEACLSRV